MRADPTGGPVIYNVAEPSDAEEVIRLLSTVFSESEPPAVSMGLSARDFEGFLRLFVPATIDEGITIVARGQDKGSLAGTLLTDDFAQPAAFDGTRISPKFLPIFSMLEELDEQFRRGKTIAPGQYLHLFMLAVDRQFAGRGVAQGMIAACLENGGRKGYRAAVTEATGRVSQHVFRKQGFVERCSVLYQEFRYEDQLAFASIHEHEKAILMEKSLISSGGDE